MFSVGWNFIEWVANTRKSKRSTSVHPHSTHYHTQLTDNHHSDVQAVECVETSCESVQYVCVFPCVCVCEEERVVGRGLFVAQQQEDKMRERWRGMEKCRVRQRRWREEGQQWLGVVNDLPEGHRQCWHDWVEYVLMRHCVKHWQISHAL